ncbi:MAG: hypothetical protein WCO05_00070 [Candidatus Moraniibacteriota bacterium]
MPLRLRLFLNKVRFLYSNYPALISVGVFLVVALLYSWAYLDNSGISTIDDHFYYFKYAEILRKGGWDEMKNFTGGFLLKTEVGQSKFGLSLFNIATVPFTFFKDSIAGLKLSDIFFASSLLALFYYVLKKANIKYPLFFTFFILASPFLIHRLLMGRPFILTIGLVFLEMFLVVKKEYRKLFLLTLVHLFWHNATFWLPLVIVGIVEIARYLVLQKFFYYNFFAVFFATASGMVFLPNFPNLWTWLGNIFVAQTSVIDRSSKVSGMELSALDAFSGRFIGIDVFFVIALICVATIIFFYIRQKKEPSSLICIGQDCELAERYIIAYSSFIFLLLLILGTMVISGRFYDYYQFTLIFLLAVIVSIFQKERLVVFNGGLYRYLAVGLVVFIALVSLNNFIELKKMIGNIRYASYIEAARWLESHSNEKELVFIHDWGSFPRLFFGDSKNVYTMGMDPTALKQYDQKLYWRWYNMYRYNFYCDEMRDCEDLVKATSDRLATQGEDAGKEYAKENGRKMVDSVKTEFGSRFIVSDVDAFSRIIALNPDLIEEHYEAKAQNENVKVDVFKLK